MKEGWRTPHRGRLRRRGQRGAALVEFAIALPILVIIGLGVADFARAYALHVSLKNAAHEGANYAQFFPSRQDSTCDPGAGDNLDITSRALNADSSLSLTVADVAIAHGKGSPPTFASYGSTCGESFAAGDSVRVTVTKSFTPVSPIGILILGSSKNLSGSVVAQVIVK